MVNVALDAVLEAATRGRHSYPTVRLRLDRLIAKITVTDSQDLQSDFERVLRARHAEGNIDADTLKALLAAYRKELEDRLASGSRSA